MGQLTEPSMPAPISMWPATAGWAWVGTAILLVLAYVVWRLIRGHRTNAYRRAALTQLRSAPQDVATVSSILRRTALVVWPRKDVASLCGPAWLEFLDRTGGDGQFANGPGKELTDAVYRNNVRPSEELLNLARHWVAHHSAPELPK
ncbi:DUF4381 domain-containing protein [Marinobacter sp. F4206]|uniref:DUF4381 domain-containing protein n=1 Tax=Marinobacter sp. F4206 TaxID=2861777 RepID=UPI001C5F0156|nr:DUF4381 domain-containing protein [Marinobacter sp. F4206]